MEFPFFFFFFLLLPTLLNYCALLRQTVQCLRVEDELKPFNYDYYYCEFNRATYAVNGLWKNPFVFLK